MAQTEQNFSNHRRREPTFLFFLFPVFLITVIVSVADFVRTPGLRSFWMVVFTAAILAATLTMRRYSLKVQDRVIRLEERLRLAAILPASQQTEVSRLDENQLVALRFASDQELPTLVARVAAEHLKPAEIKKAIVVWRPDYWRV